MGKAKQGVAHVPFGPSAMSAVRRRHVANTTTHPASRLVWSPHETSNVVVAKDGRQRWSSRSSAGGLMWTLGNGNCAYSSSGKLVWFAGKNLQQKCASAVTKVSEKAAKQTTSQQFIGKNCSHNCAVVSDLLKDLSNTLQGSKKSKEMLMAVLDAADLVNEDDAEVLCSLLFNSAVRPNLLEIIESSSIADSKVFTNDERETALGFIHSYIQSKGRGFAAKYATRIKEVCLQVYRTAKEDGGGQAVSYTRIRMRTISLIS